MQSTKDTAPKHKIRNATQYYKKANGKQPNQKNVFQFQTDSGQGLAEAGGNLEDGAHLQKKGWYV